MQVPEDLREAVEQELARVDTRKLRSAASALISRYQSGSASERFEDEVARAAYLAIRLPATYAAVREALAQTRNVFRGEIRTMLDLGSGPGTAVWAAANSIESLTSIVALERDPKMVECARRLASQSSHVALRNTDWRVADISTSTLPHNEQFDLVICSYALNELRQSQRTELIHKAWACTGKLLVVIEPGTRVGFANVLGVREQMLSGAGDPRSAERARVVAPCPHELACPLASRGDWCHFAARVERTAEHRRLKEGTLGHEDEKFSYVAFAKGEVLLPKSRIVRHVRRFAGYAELTLCRKGELLVDRCSRSQKEQWRALKRLGWGDAWE